MELCRLPVDLHELGLTIRSTLETRLQYTLLDCFETFPFPQNVRYLGIVSAKPTTTTAARIMLSRQEGLTKTYNRFHDPDESAADIQTLRDLHVEMDQAVAAAYGWTDLDLGHGFHETKQGLRFTLSEPARREVLARLLSSTTSATPRRSPRASTTRRRAKPPAPPGRPRGKPIHRPKPLRRRGRGMDTSTLLTNAALRRGQRLGIQVRPGADVPSCMWETYCAMANTDGGMIVLGCKELTIGSTSGSPIPSKERGRLERDQQPGQGQRRTCSPTNRSGSWTVRARPSSSWRSQGDPTERPVYVGQNPITGTYRRNNEGDYKCTPDEVGRMLADQAEEPADSRILEEFGIDDIDSPSLKQYRQRFLGPCPRSSVADARAPGVLDQIGGLAQRSCHSAGGDDRRRSVDVRQGRGDP